MIARASLTVVALMSFGVGLACESPRPGAGESSHDLSDLSVDDLGAGVSGTLAGAPFTAEDVYFRSFRRLGFERVDLFFSETADDECGLPRPRSGRRAFLRFDGTDALSRGEVVVTREADAGVSVHYESQVAGRWVGVGEGIARVVLDRVGESAIEGRVHVCFDDGTDSCLSGAFTARACLSRLDGFLPREGTGVEPPPPAPRREPAREPEPDSRPEPEPAREEATPP